MKPSSVWEGRTVQGALAITLGVLLALVVFEIGIALYGQAPFDVLSRLLRGTWGTGYGIGQVLFKATPLLVCGVAVDLALRAGLFNVGAEGQLAAGSFACAVVAQRSGSSVLGLVAAVFVGGLFALGPAILREARGAHEVITTILTNRVVDGLLGLLLSLGFAVAGTSRTASLPRTASLSRLGTWVPWLSGTAVSTALPLALVVTAAYFAFLRRTRIGRETELVGQNPIACAAEGIPGGRRRIVALVASGGIAGLASSATVLGYKGYFEMGLGAGVGFGGVAVAILGRGHPVGLVLAALFLGTLQQGGLAINADVPKEIVDVVSAVAIVCIALATRWVARDAARRLERRTAEAPSP